MVIPGDAHFALNVNPFVPIPTEKEIEKVSDLNPSRIQILRYFSCESSDNYSSSFQIEKRTKKKKAPISEIDNPEASSTVEA